MMASGRHHLSKTDSIFVTQVEHALPQLAQDRRLLDAFTSMVRNGEEDGLPDWLDQAKASGLAAFSRGLSADLDAVAAALREPWSNGQTEGQINRLKMLKRQMYGAAGTHASLRQTLCGRGNLRRRRPCHSPSRNMEQESGQDIEDGTGQINGAQPAHTVFLIHQDGRKEIFSSYEAT